MRFKDVVYSFLMIILMILAYLLIDRGINAKTKIYVNYQTDSDIIYDVYLNDGMVMKMGDVYPSDSINYINFDFNFKNLFTSRINGYYAYSINGFLVVYTDDINDSLLQKKYILLDKTVDTLNNNSNLININHNINIDYNKYKDELLNVGREYDMDVNGYLEVRFNVFESLNFSDIDNAVEDNKQVKAIIPLSYDNFRISVINEEKKRDSYYDFSRKQSVNYVLMIIGIISLLLGLSFLGLIIRDMINSYKKESIYNKQIKEIFNKYGDIIVKVKKFYNKKKYNLIYVDSFNELMDVYNKVGNPISFREIKKRSRSIFILIDNDNAWIYEMNFEKIK